MIRLLLVLALSLITPQQSSQQYSTSYRLSMSDPGIPSLRSHC